FQLDKKAAAEAANVEKGSTVAVVYESDGHDNLVATTVYTGDDAHKFLFADIDVQLVTEPVDLEPGTPVTHKYLLYNGASKVRLLGQLMGDKAVAPELVGYYHDDLHLNTITDAPWQWWGSGVFQATGLTWLLISITNIMHAILWALHTYVMPWSWGVCIILLTLLVRVCMFPISRRQALITAKMQALAPEIKKLQEKYKDDRQALGLEQMALDRKHGV